MTYLQLGHYETIDQIEAAKYLGSLPYVDKTRIGILAGHMVATCRHFVYLRAMTSSSQLSLWLR
ncbi:MAG: hypothetical protein IPN55_14680 [Saprospiraceae bacterium]|nr:hypothetical protein [Candidatus Brachybacter algidus]